MTLDEKMRYGMMGLACAAVVVKILGVHVLPLEIAGDPGMG